LSARKQVVLRTGCVGGAKGVPNYNGDLFFNFKSDSEHYFLHLGMNVGRSR